MIYRDPENRQFLIIITTLLVTFSFFGNNDKNLLSSILLLSISQGKIDKYNTQEDNGVMISLYEDLDLQ